MTTLITGDLHLNDNPRDDYRWLFINDVLPRLIRKHNVIKLLVLGDLTDAKDNHNSRLVNRIVERMYELGRMAHVTILHGNHDGKPGFPPFFRFLDQFDRISYINVPTVHGTGDLYLPYTSNWERDWATYRSNRDGTIGLKGNYVFAHQTFEGARVSRTRTMRGIPTNIFDPDTRVISGDIHVPQDGHVTYVGAPYTVDFGDDYKPRVLLLNGTNPPKSIALSGPQKRLVEIRSVDDLAEMAIHVGDVVKVKVYLTIEQAARFDEMRETIAAWAGECSCILHSIVPVTEIAAVERAQRRNARKERSDAQIVKDYGKGVEADDMTVRAGLGIMREVL